MRNRIGLFAPGNLDQSLGDQRTGDGSAQQVFAFVEGIGAKHRKHEVAHELFAQVFDIDLFHAEFFGLGACGFELFTLTDIGGEGDDLAAVGVLQPFEDYRGVEAAGIGENYFLDLGHGVSGVRLKRAKPPFCQLMRRVRSGCVRQSLNARAVHFACTRSGRPPEALTGDHRRPVDTRPLRDRHLSALLRLDRHRAWGHAAAGSTDTDRLHPALCGDGAVAWRLVGFAGSASCRADRTRPVFGRLDRGGFCPVD